MRRQMFTTMVLVISLSSGFIAQSQTPNPVTRPERPQSQDEVVRVTTNLVQADVTVTDKNGQPVRDLRPEDFEILEDGKRQQITHFSYIDATTSASSETGPSATEAAKDKRSVMPARLNREQVQRTIALVVDDLGLSFESFGFVRKALEKFVNDEMQPNDLVAILRTSGGAGVLQQFTSEKRQLLAAIESVRWNPQGRGGLSATGTLNEQSINADIRDNIQFTEEMEESRAGQYSVGTLGAVSTIIRGLGEMPGRKSLVLLSEAFRLFSAQGRNTQLVQMLSQLTDEANTNSVAIYTLDASGLQSYTFQASDRVAGYSYLIDPQVLAATGGTGGGGVGVNPPPRTLPRADTLAAQAEQDSGAAFRRLGALMNQRDQQAGENHTVLSYLAQRTGGLFLRNRNDIASGLTQIMQDQEGFYLLGFRPREASIDPATGRRRLHNLQVKVRRSGLQVRSRAGYFGVTDEDRRPRRTPEEKLTAALLSPFASGDIRVRLTTLFGDEPNKGGTYLRSLLHIDARDLTFKQEHGGARKAEIQMVAVAYGDSGRVVDQLGDPQNIVAENEAAYQQLLKDGLTFILNVPIKDGGPYQMRIAVSDRFSGRIGSAMQFVEVPNLTKNRVALSGIVLIGLAADNPNADPEPHAGPAVRRFRQGNVIEYRYNIYNALTNSTNKTPQVQAQTRLLKDGVSVFTGRLASVDVNQQANLKRLSVGGRLRLGPELTPGHYVFQVIVSDKLAPEPGGNAMQWIDFEIID